jgi:MYXO-CTERM domain-containing protein
MSIACRSILIAVATVVAAPRAEAFCGFYVGGANAELFNNATQVVLMRHGTTTVLAMQNNYQGPPAGFALVVPVPVVIQPHQVKTLPREIFAKVDTLGAPRLVEYWEHDPCHTDDDDEDEGGGDGEDSSPRKKSKKDSDEDSDYREYKVKVEAKFSVSEYDIAVLSAQESTGLDRYLRANRYEIPKGVEPLLRPYVEQGTKFFVAKVDPTKVKFVNGMATLSPLRFHYESPELTLPIRLGLANSSGAQDLIVNILAHETRYEVANYPNVTIPTNVIVRDEVRGRFGEFYTALFDHAVAQVPGAVVTEYAWSAASCDPCPGPTLDQSDLATLGADVLSTTYQNVNARRFTLTRLHARYGKDIKDDLVFRAVSGIVGGRGIPSVEGKLDSTVQPARRSAFQGRYVILHPFTGTITCEAPHRGEWGGPERSKRPQAATNIAFAPRGRVSLAAMIATDVPEANLISSNGAQVPSPPRQPKGCGCRAEAGAGALAGGLVVLGILLRRRRRV